VSNWDTNKVTSMIRMFYSQSLTSLDLSKWNTTAVEYADDMFPYYLEELTMGKEFRFDGKTGIREKKDAQFSGYWIGPSGTRQTLSEFTELIQNYDGSQPGTYVREQTK
ncbi:BspA family leucine-rich repeat surface protein, partial [Enterococcus silesiacus]